MAFDLTGKVYAILDEKQVSDKFRKQDFVLEVTDGKYSQLVSFQVVNDKIDGFSAFQLGDEVTVSFNVRGREWKSPGGEVKYFNTLDAWKVKRAGASAPASLPRGGAHETPRTAAPAASSEPPPIGDNDIPFASADMVHEPSPIARILRH